MGSSIYYRTLQGSQHLPSVTEALKWSTLTTILELLTLSAAWSDGKPPAEIRTYLQWGEGLEGNVSFPSPSPLNLLSEAHIHIVLILSQTACQFSDSHVHSPMPSAWTAPKGLQELRALLLRIL